jgi:hypothetical protein
MNKYLTLTLTLAAIVLSGCAHQPEPLAEAQYFECNGVDLRPYAQPKGSTNRLRIPPGVYEAKNAITVGGQQIPVIEYGFSGWISVPLANDSKEGFYMLKKREASYVYERGNCQKISKPASMPKREGWNQW